MDNQFAGLNGFVWWVGVVEDRQDPLKLGRCRVRIFGWHSENVTEVPTELLPWAQAMMPLNNSNPYTPKESDVVVGFFLDANNAQIPVMMGVLPGIPLKEANPQQGFNDQRTTAQLNTAPVKLQDKKTHYPRHVDEPTTSRLARNDVDYTSPIIVAKKAKKASKVEPDSYYAAKYPYNKVYESESGHALEFDDTKDNERIHLYHRSGSYVEYGPLGDRSEKVQRNKFTVVVGDDSIYVQGSVKMYVDGDYDLNVTGDIRMNGKTVNINQGTMGAARIGDTADTGDQGTGSDNDVNLAGTNVIESGSGTVFIGD